MNALDLNQRPPRSPRVRLGGFAILPRMLDKVRANAAGTLGEYVWNCRTDQFFFRFTGLTAAQMLERAKTGAGDWEMLLWVNENSPIKHSALEIGQWSDWMETVSFADVDSRKWFTEEIERLNPEREDIVGIFDYLDLDDYASFGGRP